MDYEKIKLFAQKEGYQTIHPLGAWNGYECYEPITDESEITFTGPPLVILVKDEIIRMSTEEEAFQQIDDMGKLEYKRFTR